MQQPQRYMFDTCFDEPLQSDELLAEREAAHRAELEAARAVARQEGFADGQADMRTSLEAGIKELCGQLSDSFTELLERLDADTEIVRQEACALAIVSAEVLSGGLLQDQPGKAIEALFRDCLSHVGAAPVIEVSVDAMLAEALQNRLSAAASEAGLDSRVVVRGLHGAAQGQCAIRWRDGGADWDLAAAKRAVRERIEGYLLARAATLSRQRSAEPALTTAPAAASADCDTGALKVAAK